MGADGKPSLRQIGDDLGISASLCGQAEANAFRKLRENTRLLSELRFVYDEYLEEGRGARGEDWDV